MNTDLSFQPKIIGIICNWCCYGGADLCGVSRFQYPPHIRLIRVMCSARVDMLHVLQAFKGGQDGVFIGGCHLCDCHYVTNGNFNAFSMVQVFRKILGLIGIFPERLRIEWVSAGEGIRFANFMNEYSDELTKLGPIGRAEGIADHELSRRFEAVQKLIPYIKLVLTRRMNIQPRTEETYHSFFTSNEFEKLFNDLIARKLVSSRIMSLLKQGPLGAEELSGLLDLGVPEVSGYLDSSSRQGMVRYDTGKKKYELVLH